jgi:hypothetical protein
MEKFKTIITLYDGIPVIAKILDIHAIRGVEYLVLETGLAKNDGPFTIKKEDQKEIEKKAISIIEAKFPKPCTCGKLLSLKESTFIGAQRFRSTILMFNCKYCETTFAFKLQEL